MPTLYSYSVKTARERPLNARQKEQLQACFNRAAQFNFPHDVKIMPEHPSDDLYDTTQWVGFRISSLRPIEVEGIQRTLTQHIFGEQLFKN